MLNLDRDFDPKGKIQGLDKSTNGVKAYVDHETLSTWYVKPLFIHIGSKKVISSMPLIDNLIASKIFKYLFPDYAATIQLINDDEGLIYIASKSVPNFKTLGFVGDECSNKPINNFELLAISKFLVGDHNSEPSNNGVVIENESCSITNIDLDEARIEQHTEIYFVLDQEFSSLHNLLNIGFRFSISKNDMDQYQIQREDYVFSLENIDMSIQAKVQQAIEAGKPFLFINAVDMVNLDLYVPSGFYYDELVPHKHRINLDKFYYELQKVISIEKEIFDKIVHESVSEAVNALGEQHILSTHLISNKNKSITDIEEIYSGYLKDNLHQLAHVFDVVKKMHDIQICYEVFKEHYYNGANSVSYLYDKIAQQKNHVFYSPDLRYDLTLSREISAKEDKFCKQALEDWSDNSQVRQWIDLVIQLQDHKPEVRNRYEVEKLFGLIQEEFPIYEDSTLLLHNEL